MIELFDDFRDLLVELHNAGARFVVLGGHAVAFHGHPRATKDLGILVEADADNAKRVYAALAAFGAPLSAFEVGVEDFALELPFRKRAEKQHFRGPAHRLDGVSAGESRDVDQPNVRLDADRTPNREHQSPQLRARQARL
jgi:hypothetical protein